MGIHVFFMFPETAGKPLEEVTAMFEDPNGIKYIGTPVSYDITTVLLELPLICFEQAWKTKGYYSKAVRMEHGSDLEQKSSSGNESLPRHSEAYTEKTDI